MPENPLVLSASSVTTFLRCGTQWENAYVKGIRLPPTLKQARGLAVHEAVEVNMRQKVDTREDLPISDVMDAAHDAYVRQAVDAIDDPKEVAIFAGSTVDLAAVYHREIAPEIQPIAVEIPVQFEIDGTPYSGQVDIIDEMERVRDTKTTARRPKPESYTIAMTGYALSYRQGTGKKETDTILDYVVATQKPYPLPITAGGPVTDSQVRSFATIVSNVAGAINAGRFVPNGITSGACGWCGYRIQCPAYIRSRTEDVPTT